MLPPDGRTPDDALGSLRLGEMCFVTCLVAHVAKARRSATASEPDTSLVVIRLYPDI